METFDAAWLELREPVDHRSRASGLVAPLVELWTGRGWTRVLDLGGGAGSNLRYLAPRLPGEQDWTVVERDPAHLRTLGRLAVAADGGAGGRGSHHRAEVVRMQVVPGDLAREGLTAIEGTHLVTASALLDLVSAGWLDGLVSACTAARCGVLFALSYNGEIRWSAEDDAGRPDEEEADDRFVQAAVNIHQTGDKGLGPALGPDAGRTAGRAFERAGWRCLRQPSPWRLGVGDTDLVYRLIAGWAAAAAAVRPAETGRIAAWAVRRRAAVARGRFSLTVGHDDLLACPPGRA